jgi:hypothetical protein
MTDGDDSFILRNFNLQRPFLLLAYPRMKLALQPIIASTVAPTQQLG